MAAAPGAGVSAETPHPPWRRCPPTRRIRPGASVEDGPAISVSTARIVACTAALSWMTSANASAVLALGRQRRPSSTIRRAARGRDHGRSGTPAGVPPDQPAPHPALGQRRPNRPGQPDQLLCPWHHAVIHARLHHRRPARRRRRVHLLPPGRYPAAVLPAPARRDGPINGPRRDITPDAIIPPWYGERLDLNHAIWAFFAKRSQEDAGRARMATRRTRVALTIYEPEDCDERYRQYLDDVPGAPPRPDPDSGVTARRARPSQRAGFPLIAVARRPRRHRSRLAAKPTISR